jgi:hypothetical protein
MVKPRLYLEVPSSIVGQEVTILTEVYFSAHDKYSKSTTQWATADEDITYHHSSFRLKIPSFDTMESVQLGICC